MLLGYGMCASFCTIKESLKQMKILREMGHEILPILTPLLLSTDTRFGMAEEVISQIVQITGKDNIIRSVKEAEPLGPAIPLDALIVSPCTGNTLAKIANGFSDTSVTMAVKAHLRCDRPLVLALASNDALSQNLKNIATLLTRKNTYFVPMHEDDPVRKPHSLVADFSRLPETLALAMEGRENRPLFLS